MAKGKKEGRAALDAKEVLRRRPHLSARDLIDLIHSVNPTGKEVSTERAAASYSMKAGLQSLLIEQHKDQMRVTPGESDGVVSLHHVTLGKDACHVPLDALETEARLWVQWQIDLGNESDEPQHEEPLSLGRTIAAIEVGTASSLLQSAQKALVEYDFGGAQEFLNEAHRLSPNDVRPVNRLLELLVDVLGLDSDALTLGAGLAPSLIEIEQIRARLALAAARLGKVNEALSWRRGLRGMPLASVDVALANGALGGGDLVQAAQYLLSAQKEWSTNPDILDLSARLDIAQALAVVPLVEELDQGNQPDAALVALAQKILCLHPDNHKARQFMKTVASHSQAEAEGQVTSQLQSSLREGDVDRLRSAISRAQLIGLSNEMILTHERGLASLLSLQQAKALADKVEQTVAELRSGQANGALAQGLRLYVRLVPEGRALVRKAFFTEEIGWIDTMISNPTGEGRRDRIVEAVLAMTLAAARAANEQYAEALTECEPHRSILVEHKVGRALLDRLAVGLSATQSAQAEFNLIAAVNALRSGSLDNCGACLSRVKKSSLSPAAVALFAETTLELEARRARNQQVNAAHDASSREHHVEAFRRFENLARVPAGYETGAQRLTFTQQAHRLAEVVRQEWVLMDERNVEHDPVEFAKALSPHLLSNSGDADVVLADDDAIAVMCDAWGPYIFVRFVDLVHASVRRFLMLRAPDELRLPEFFVIGGSIWVSDCLGHILQIEINDGLPRTWSTLESLALPKESIDSIMVFPESHAIRVILEKRTGSHRTLVLDMDSLRVSRVHENVFVEHIVPGTSPLAVASISHTEAGRIVSPRGVELVHFSLPHRYRALTVAVNPSAAGFVLLACPDGDLFETEEQLHFLVTDHDERGGLRSSIKLPAHAEMRYSLAVDRKKGGIYVFVNLLETGDPALCILSWENGNLNVRRTIPAPAGLTLFQSSAAGSVVATWSSAAGMRFVVLDMDIELLEDDSVEELRLHGLDDDWCQPSLIEQTPDQVSIVSRIAADRPDSDSEQAEWARNWFKQVKGNVVGLLALLECTKKLPMTMQEEFLLAAETLEPNHKDVLLARVYLEARKGVWLGDDFLDDDRQSHKEHLQHLKGLMQFKRGQVEDALATWQSSTAHSMCRLDDLCKLAEVVGDGANSRLSFRAKKMNLAALYGATLVADELVSTEDFKAACAALDQPWIRMQRETQTCARLVRLLLLSPPSTGLQTFNRALVLAMFLSELAQGETGRNMMVYGRAIAPTAIEELAAAAKLWFGGLAALTKSSAMCPPH